MSETGATQREAEPAGQSSQRHQRHQRKWDWRVWTRIAGTGLALIFLLSSADLLRETWLRLSGIALGTWLLAAAVHTLTLVMSAERLGTLIEASGHHRPRARVFVDLLQATALNAILLMGSGELLRVQRVQRSVGSVALSAGLVVADRGIGVALLALTGGLAWLGFAPYSAATVSLTSPFVWLAVAAALAAAAFGYTRLRSHIDARALAAWRALRDMPGALARVGVASVLAVASWILSLQLVAASLGLSVPVTALAYAAPIVAIATIVPISIGGIGVREAGYALLLAAWGVGPADAVSLGLAQYGIFLVIAALGALSMLLPGEANSVKVGERA